MRISSANLALLLGFSYSAQAMAIYSAKDPCTRVRAAFDIGSSQTKVKVFEIDACKGKIIKQLFPEKGNKAQDDASRADIPFKKDLEENYQYAKDRAYKRGVAFNEDMYPRFSDDIIVQAQDAFGKLKEAAKDYSPSSYIGVATEAFRQSENSDYLIHILEEKFGIDMLIPTQAQESFLEWVAATSDFAAGHDTTASKIATWGIGGGSMQIGAKAKGGEFVTFPSKLASDEMYDRAVKDIKGAEPLLPLSLAQMNQLSAIAFEEAGNASAKIKGKIGESETQILGVGGVINKSIKKAMEAQKYDRPFFTDRDIELLIQAFADKEEGAPEFGKIEPKYQGALMSNLALVSGTMRALGITKVYYSSIDNTYAAPFMSEFAIKMPPRKKPKAPKPVVEVSATGAVAARKPIERVSDVVAPSNNDVIVSETRSSGGTGINQIVCNNTPDSEKVVKGKTCIIKDPCARVTNWCTGGVVGKKCTVNPQSPGDFTNIYTLCE